MMSETRAPPSCDYVVMRPLLLSEEVARHLRLDSDAVVALIHRGERSATTNWSGTLSDPMWWRDFFSGSSSRNGKRPPRSTWWRLSAPSHAWIANPVARAVVRRQAALPYNCAPDRCG